MIDVLIDFNWCCWMLPKQGGAGDGFPDLINSLIGRRMLFKVETKLEQMFNFDGSFPIRRLCYDDVIMSMFDLVGGNFTPM